MLSQISAIANVFTYKVVPILVILLVNVSNPESEARLLMIYFLELQITNGKRSD